MSKTLENFQGDYLFRITDLLHYKAVQRKIEITEFKLGIYNPDNPIADVDMLDNPTYKEWKYYDVIHKGELYRRALIRPGKSIMTRAFIEKDILNEIKKLSNIISIGVKLWTKIMQKIICHLFRH